MNRKTDLNRIKNLLIIAVFAVVIFGLAIAKLVTPDKDASLTERRTLAQKPELTAEGVFSSDLPSDKRYFNQLETYLLDQFPLREPFRTVNAVTRFYALLQKDADGVWLDGDAIYKMEYPLAEDQITFAGKYIERVINTYFQSNNVYYSIIPDKNYFAAEENGSLSLDYERLTALMNENVSSATYIDIFNTLSAEAYYRTDTHWSQEKLLPTVQRLCEGMGSEDGLAKPGDYERHELYPFYGVLMGQAAMSVEPDTIVYLTSAYTDASTVTGLEKPASTVYVPEKINDKDAYDVFLSGPQMLLTIECPNASTDRELIIIRDSFGSAITPLMLGAYAKITVVDLRYLRPSVLGSVLEITGDEDVLFLYSTLVLNSAKKQLQLWG